MVIQMISVPIYDINLAERACRNKARQTSEIKMNEDVSAKK